MKALLIEINSRRHCLAGVESGYVSTVLSICTGQAGTLIGLELSDGDTVTIQLVETDIASPPEISGVLRRSNT
jgi:hypothetical protein